MSQNARLGFSFTLLFPVAFLLLWMLIGPTLTGKLVAFSVLAILLIPVALMWLRARGLSAGLLGALSLLSLSWAISRMPPAPPANAPLTARELGPGSVVRLFVPELVPEVDQVYFGLLFVPYFDTITFKAARRLRELEMTAYGEIESDSAFHGLRPATDRSLDELFFLPFDDGHVFEYTPPHTTQEKLPAVIFLHGSLGNFQVYLWAMKRFADRYHCVVVLPTFGLGNWQQKGGVEAVERAREHAVRDLPVDANRVFLVGLSNGGLGVSRAGLAHPDRYAGLAYISGVLEDEVLEQPRFTASWRGRPLLGLYGAHDDRISADESTATFKKLSEAGVHVTTQVFPDEDHFLFLSQLDAVLGELATWTRSGAEH